MTKFKHLLLFVCIAGCFAACKKDDPIDDFDYEGQYRTDTTLIRKFIVDNKIAAVKDPTGVFYQVIDPGARVDTVIYSRSTLISGPYEGKLLNGTSFGSGTLTSQTLGGLIPGWIIGIPHIQKGGKIRMLIPSYYGYGNTAQGTIPANSVLDFTVTLTDVK